MALSPISHLETSHETPEMQTQHFSRRGCGASVGVLAPTPSGDWQHCQLTGFKQHDYLHFSRSAMCCCKFAVAQIRASASHWPRAGGLHPQGNSGSQGKFRCVGLWEQTSCSLWLVANSSRHLRSQPSLARGLSSSQLGQQATAHIPGLLHPPGSM